MESYPVNKIFRDVNLSQKEKDIIKKNIKERFVQKGDIILTKGQSAPYLYFVSSGCLRTFFIDSSGKDHTLQFAVNDWWITDYTAFLVDGNAMLNIECIKDAILYEVSKENLELLYKRVPKIERFFRIKFERSLISFQKRLLSYMVQSAKERYIKFIDAYSTINKSIKNYHVASYLGITPESLSRIKKDLTTE
jgi:CRP-like cAMP-binding protein